MYHERDFWEAIARASSDDDSPCWMYADWLEEQGDIRGEFVRAQCELERLAPWRPERMQLAERCQQLFSENSAEWTSVFSTIDYAEIRFRRGVPADVEWSAKAFLTQCAELLELAPTIKRIKLTDVIKYDVGVVLSMLWEQFTHIDLSANDLGDDGLARLLPTNDLQDVEAIELASNELTSLSLQRLIDRGWARGAAWGLNFNRLGEAAAEIIADEAARTELPIRGLSLRGNRLGDVGFQTLARAHLPQLTSLDLRDNGLTSFAAVDLQSAESRLTALETLDLRENSLQQDGARRLADSSLLESVTNLQLRNNGLECAGALAIAQARDLEPIAALGLGANRIGDESIERLIRLKGLNYLDLSGNLIDDQGVRAIVDYINETEIELVDLSNHHFSTRSERLLRELNDERIRF